MNVLVTGGGGFIGSALARQLVTQGDKVVSFSRGDYPALRRLGIEIIRGNLSDREAIVNACTGRDIVFHVAAKVGVWGSYKAYYQSNVQGTENVVKACLAHGVDRLIFTSSASVVFNGSNIEGMNESLPYPSRPMSHYTATKALAEKGVIAANSSNLKTLSLRLHLVWGPGDKHILPGIIKRAKAGKLRRIGNDDHLIDTTYIDNAVSAHICAAKTMEQNSEVAGKAYFISNGEPIPLMDFINNILKSAGLPPVNCYVSVKTALAVAGFLELVYKGLGIQTVPRLTRFLVHELSTAHWFDISSARKLLGYSPKVTIQEGLERLAVWFHQQDVQDIDKN